MFKLSANLLLVASVLCVLFGNGTHVHIVDHITAHSHFHAHAHVHAHNANTSHDANSGFNGNDDHQHPIASVELDGRLSQKTVNDVLNDDVFFTVAGALSSFSMKEVNPIYLDLPPPVFLFSSEYYYSLSLRGPPLV